MAPGRRSDHARTAINQRPSPYPSNAPIAPQAQASSSRAFHIHTSPDHSPLIKPVILRHEKHRDDMPVKSTEGQEQGYTGMRHYTFIQKQKKLDSKPSLDHVDSRDADADPTDSDAPFEAEPNPDPYTFTGPPTPPSNTAAYTQPIYIGSTHNPSVFLAILNIAQRNLPSMNLSSALNHVPNIRPTDKLPSLNPTAPGNLAPAPFLDAQRPKKRVGDEDISVAFLPYFYDTGLRHGIAFFQYARDVKRGRVLGTACVAPCTEEDLQRFGLVEYINAKDLDGVIGQHEGEEVEGVDLMDQVGVEGGKWLERDTVEDWEEWRTVFRTCAVVWEARMRLMRGDHEG